MLCALVGDTWHYLSVTKTKPTIKVSLGTWLDMLCVAMCPEISRKGGY